MKGERLAKKKRGERGGGGGRGGERETPTCSFIISDAEEESNGSMILVKSLEL